MVERYERFRLETGARGPQVVLDQRRNGVGNAIIGSGIALTGYFFLPQIGEVLMGVGVFWAALAFCALLTSRVLILGDPLEFTSGRKTRTLPRREVTSLRVYRQQPRTGRGRPPLPWTVEIRREETGRPFAEFRFTGESAARRFAERMGQFLGVAPEQA